MNCPQCKKYMEGVGVSDTGGDEIIINNEPHEIAMNVYICNDCHIVARENVWDFKGVVFIYPDQITEKGTQRDGSK